MFDLHVVDTWSFVDGYETVEFDCHCFMGRHTSDGRVLMHCNCECGEHFSCEYSEEWDRVHGEEVVMDEN